MNTRQSIGIAIVICISLLLFKFLSAIFGAVFLVVGIGLVFSVIKKEDYEFPTKAQLRYNASINTPVRFKLEEINYIREPVPKKIYRTHCSPTGEKVCGGRKMDMNVITFTQNILYDWEQVIYSDEDIKNFLIGEFGANHIVTKAYYLINPKYGAARADLFRYLIIYKYGGLYLDIKSCVKSYIPEMPENADMWVSGWDKKAHPHLFPETGEYQNWYIYARKGSPILKDIIEGIIDNIYSLSENPNKKVNMTHERSKSKGIVLSVTGPIAMTIAILKSKNIQTVYYNNTINKCLQYNCSSINTLTKSHYSYQTSPLIIPQNIINYIPKVVYMTYYDLDVIPEYVKNNIYKYCSGYDIQLYDDEMCMKFLLNYYGADAVAIFKNMKNKAHAADFWRYCVLYTFGGYYFDIKTDFQVHIDEIFNNTTPKTWYTVLCSSKKCLYNGIIVTPSHNPVILQAIKNIYKDSNPHNYLQYVNDFLGILKNTLKHKIKTGDNIQKNNWNCVIFEENCISCNGQNCDRYGYNCIIKDNNRKLFNTRYTDFSMET